MQTPDAVVLDPGFLGFSRFGGFHYVAERVVAVVRSVLEKRLGYYVLRLVPEELPAIRRLQVARDVIAFLAEVTFHRDLIADLRPAHMEKIRSTLKRDPGGALNCFVTGTQLRARSERPGDSFFTDMYALTKGDGTASPAVGRCRRLLQDLITRKPDLVIRTDHRRMPRTMPGEVNDGVVNTIRQVVDPDDRSQVGGFVVADHADVLGHYDRQDSLIEDTPCDAGLFHGGAGCCRQIGSFQNPRAGRVSRSSIRLGWPGSHAS